jgi:phosphate acetyltransferase
MILEQIRSRAASDLQHIILPEGDDPRTLTAAEICTRDRVAKITIIGAEDKIRSLASESGANLNGVDIIDHRKSSDFGRMATLYYDLRRAKGQTLEEAEQTVKDPLYYGNLLVREGKADGSVAGATNTTAHTVAAAIRCIGVRQGFKIVSSFFLMVVPDKKFGAKGAMIYADCGVVVDPDIGELAEIAIASADSCRALLQVEPRVAMLSFSTKGSAKHKLIDKVVEATKTVKARMPDLAIDGELQADAALIQSVAESKAPGSNVAGKANVLIFPISTPATSLTNLPNASPAEPPIGPILQGLIVRAMIFRADAKPKILSMRLRSLRCKSQARKQM